MQYLLIPVDLIKDLELEGAHRGEVLVHMSAWLSDVKTIDLVDADAKPYIPNAIEGGTQYV